MNFIDWSIISHKRTIRYLALFFITYSLYFVAIQSSWEGGENFHILMEVISSFIALLVGTITMVRYYTKKSYAFLFISTAFLGAGVLDLYHALLSSSFIRDFYPQVSVNTVLWSSFPSRMFLSFLLFLSLVGNESGKVKDEWKKSEVQVYIFAATLLFGSLFFFLFIPLPKDTLDGAIPKPQEYIPATFFLLSIIGFVHKGEWRRDYFQHLLILSLIVGFVGQSLFMASSHESHDIMFNSAHFLKIISYMCVLIGLIISMYELFIQAETGKDLLSSQNVALKETRAEMERALKLSVEKEAELASKVRDLEESKLALSNVIEDLDQEKNKVEEARVKDEAMLSSIGEGLIVTDKGGITLLINKQAELTLGWKAEEVVGKNWSEFLKVHDEKGNIVSDEENPMAIALTSSKKVTSVYLYTRRDNTKFPIIFTASPVIMGGKIVGAIIVFRDVTHEKEVDRMKTEFISLASHQLRTPLSATKWFSEMLLDGDAGEMNREQRKFVENIMQSTERMIELVNSLLNISRIESGRIIVDPKPTDLSHLVREVLDDLSGKYLRKKQKMIISIHKNLPKINLDRKLVRQVYMNLLTNAIKYTQEGGEISVFISQKGDEVISQISDNGYGIPQKEQSKIFQKFYRAENIVKIETDGTGLGLYLVKAIIESSKGRIWFESDEGKGATFYFTFPLSGMVATKGEVALDA